MLGTANATLKVRFPLTFELDMDRVLESGAERQQNATLGGREHIGPMAP